MSSTCSMVSAILFRLTFKWSCSSSKSDLRVLSKRLIPVLNGHSISVQLDEVIDEIEEVSRRDGHGSSSALDDALVGRVEGLVDVDHRVDDGVSVIGKDGHIGSNHGEVVGSDPLRLLEVDLEREPLADLEIEFVHFKTSA